MNSPSTRTGRLLPALLLAVSIGFAEQGAKYLIIAADAYTAIVQPLARWKTQKGVLAKVVPVSQVGSSAAQIQAYVRNAYNTWPVRPEYVCLVGGPAQIVSYNNANDCYYGNMTGDYVMEISVGRLFATTARECSTMVNKVLVYERPSDPCDTTWYFKGLTTVREDNAPDDTFYWGDSRMLHNYWRACGFTVVDSFSMNRGNTSAQVNAAASDGRMFLTYRGQGVSTWWSPFNAITPSTWNNGEKLPIGIAGTCQTLTLANGESMYADQFVRAGTPGGLGGAVAYFGTSGVVSHGAFYRSAVYRGFVKAIYEEKLNRLGPAANRGRWRCDSLYHVQARYEEWNLLGDPELNVWTGAPRRGQVSYDSITVMGPQDMTVTVNAGGSPVAGAQVCLWLDTTVYAVGSTNGGGQAVLAINPAHVGVMLVTVTGQNLRPFEGTCQVTPGNAPYVVGAGAQIDDYAGNSDGVLNPGEGVRARFGLRNIGRVAAPAVQAVLRTSGGHVAVSDSISVHGDILPDSTSWGDQFEFRLDTLVGDGYVVPALLHVQDGAGDTWNVPLGLVVRAGRLTVAGCVLLDPAPGGNGNGRLGRCESGRLVVAVRNAGGALLDGVRGVVERVDTNVVVTDSFGFYGAVRAGQTKNGDFDWFAVSAGPGLSKARPVRFRVLLLGDGGTYRQRDTGSFEVAAEQGLINDPTGPDPYGYWCYDNTDTSSGRAPVYSWLELAPPGPGTFIPQVSDSDAFTVTLPLPFQFRMYGVNDNFVSVNSNGWLCLGYSTYRSGYNRPIPDTTGPGLMMDPFWDDLNPNENRNGYGAAYQYYDTAGHRWLVEFKDYAHSGQQGIRETFQAILLDPVYHQTPTGDGEVIYLYNRVSLSSGCTIGVKDNTETRGIQYLYNNSYDPTAAYVQASRTLRFTTWPPRTANAPWVVLDGVRVSDSLHGNSNGLFEAGESLDVVVTLLNRGVFDAVGTAAVIRSLDPDATVLDSAADFGTIGPGGRATNAGQPFLVEVADLPADSLVDFCLGITASGYVTSGYFAVPLDGVTAVTAEKPGSVTFLSRVMPNPMVGAGLVSYGLARGSSVDLGLYDATGRRVLTLARGVAAAGTYSVRVPAGRLAAGVYFCRLRTSDGAAEVRLTEKLQVAR